MNVFPILMVLLSGSAVLLWSSGGVFVSGDLMVGRFGNLVIVLQCLVSHTCFIP